MDVPGWEHADKYLFSICICICIFSVFVKEFDQMDVLEWQHADKYLFPHFVGETVDQYYWQELGGGGSGGFLINLKRSNGASCIRSELLQELPKDLLTGWLVLQRVEM